MTLHDAANKLQQAGYSWPELKTMINRLIDQNNMPTSSRVEG